MKVIVTGGAGFIGSALVRYLIEHTEAHVVVIDKLTYAANLGSLGSVASSDRYTFFEADICDLEKMREIFRDSEPHYVLHLAAESHVDRSITGSQAFVQTNIIGTYNLLETTREYFGTLNKDRQDAFRFLHVSTDEVYGSLGPTGLFKETTAYDPSSPYSASKAASDHLVKAWFRTYGVPLITSNCSNNYGPFHFPEKLIPLMILNALEGVKLPVYGDGSNIRDWVHVEDHVRALWLIVTTGVPGQTYNVGGKNERTNLQVVESICDILDELVPSETPRRQLIEFVSDRPGHDHRYAIDASKLENELDWSAEETFDTGLRKTIQWYLNNEKWWRPLRSTVYSGSRLGLIGI